jgi:hypothetical protein
VLNVAKVRVTTVTTNGINNSYIPNDPCYRLTCNPVEVCFEYTSSIKISIDDDRSE